MKFSIITIDDSRADLKQNIRRVMGDYEEVPLDAFNARDKSIDLYAASKLEGLVLPEDNTFKRGEVGGWLSHFRSWKLAASLDEPLLVFEDDALLPDNFAEVVAGFVPEVPTDYDFISLCIPEDQKPDYMWINEYSRMGEPNIIGRYEMEAASQHYVGQGRVARSYIGYGHTAVLFSPRGAAKLVDAATELGMITPADCFILNMSHCNRVMGYAPKPAYTDGFAVFNNEIKSIIGSMK